MREVACAGLTGRVLEIGFGSGLNVRWYPPEVTSVTADRALRPGLAAVRARGARAPAAGRARRARRAAPRPARRLARQRARHLQPVHDPRPAARAARGTPGGARRWSAPLARARAGARRVRTPLAAPARAGAAGGRRRLPPHAGHPGAACGGGVARRGLEQAYLPGPACRPAVDLRLPAAWRSETARSISGRGAGSRARNRTMTTMTTMIRMVRISLNLALCGPRTPPGGVGRVRQSARTARRGRR